MTARFSTLAFMLALAAAPAIAQDGPVVGTPPPQPATAQAGEADDGGLTGTVSDENEWQDLGIAITTFATDADVPTQTNAGSTAQLGRAISQVISSDLKNNGLFKPTGPDGLPQPTLPEVQSPTYATWSGRGADMLVQGYVKAGANG
jgi:TolB protein